jgi:cytochrome c551/c552
MRIQFPIVGLLLAALTSASGQAPPDGAALFTQNCSACHMLDRTLVGPSLVEIRTLYQNKPDAFLKWCVAPGKKRLGAIEMPSMIHVGEPGLLAIHAHIMAISKGVIAQKPIINDPFIASPTQTARPLVQRIFMPDAGPAAIAVALDDKTSLCWDAGECRLRYAWTGGFVDGYPYWRANGSSQAKITGTVRYTEPTALFPGKPEFKGYQIKDGLPIFRYLIGSRAITETFTATTDGQGITRTFTVSPPPSAPLVLKLTPTAKVKTTCDTGTLVQNQLTLIPEQAARFTLTHRFQ